VNFWGTIIFGTMMTVGLGSELYKKYWAEPAPPITAASPRNDLDKPVAVQRGAPESPPVQTTEPKQATADSADVSNCIQLAQKQGYRSGQCAFTFIDVCVRTQSRSEMEKVLRADAMLGMGTATSCPNMPATYQAQFDKF
jgi:hypothetical protein